MLRKSIFVLGAIMLLAASLRFWRLNELPPGLFGDEALVALHARQVAATGQYPVYFAQPDGGFHPGIVYLTLIARWLTANHPYAGRFGVAAAGVLSIPLVFLAFREILRLDFAPAPSRRWALVGALILAITFPSIVLNRLGFEGVLPVLAGALVFLFLARALRLGQRRDFVLAGLALGLALYTYYSARFLPVAVTLALGWVALLEGRAQFKAKAVGFAWITVCALLVFVPLGLFFMANPHMFFARASVTGAAMFGDLGQLPGKLLEATWRTLAALSIDGFGDFIARHNLPWRAVYDPFLSTLFWLGVAAALWHARRRSSALLVCWFGCMQLPVIITYHLNAPHYTRMQGAFPAMAGLGMVGAQALFDWLAKRLPAAWGKPAVLALLGVGFAFSLGTSSYDYFERWANDPALFDAFQVAEWRAANVARERLATDVVLLTPDLLTDNAHAAFNLLLTGTAARDFSAADCLVYVDQPPRPLTFVINTFREEATLNRLRAVFPAGREGPTVLQPDGGWPLFQVFEVPAGAIATPPPIALQATFGGEIELLGYGLSAPTLQPGTTLTLTLYWRAAQAVMGEYNAFVHLLLPDGQTLVAQADGPPCNGRYLTPRWGAGQVVVETRLLTIPPDWAGETAALSLGWYRWPSLERLAVTDTAAELPNERVLLTELSRAP